MNRSMSSERGSAMVMALGVLTVLALLAVIVLAVVSANKRTESSDYANNRSFYSADAASEAGVHWLHTQGSPPDYVDTLKHVSVSTAYTSLADDHRYRFNVKFAGYGHAHGWSAGTGGFRDYQYVIEATGASAQQSQSTVSVMATRTFKQAGGGY